MIYFLLSWRSKVTCCVSGRPGDDPDGGLSGPSDVLVLLLRGLAPPHQEGELLQQEAAALRSFSQRGQSPQGVHDEGLPPLLLLLLPFVLRHQVEEDGDDVQIQTLLLTCNKTLLPDWSGGVTWCVKGSDRGQTLLLQ